MSVKGLVIASILCTLFFCAKQYWNYSDDKKAYKKYLAVKEDEKAFSRDSLERFRLDSIWILTNPTLVKIDSSGLRSEKDTSGLTGGSLPKDTTRKLLNDSLAKAAKNDTLTKEQKKDKGAWEGITTSLKYDSTATENNHKSMRSGYGKLWKQLLPVTQQHEAEWLYKIGVWDIGSMMFLGMALACMGFFDQRFSKNKYLFVGLVFLVIGLLLAWIRVSLLDAKIGDYAKYINRRLIPPDMFLPIEKMIMAVGYAGMIMFLLRVGILNWLWRSLAAVGRMALTNYILQTLICTIFFYGYGMGYYGRFSQVSLYVFVLEVWMVQIIFSVFWLRYFTMGPLEWLLARLVYGRWFIIKKNTLPPATASENNSTN
jgi:uncharacterized protein